MFKTYSDGQKSCTFCLEFLYVPHSEGGPIFKLVRHESTQTKITCNSLNSKDTSSEKKQAFHKIDQFQNWSTTGYYYRCNRSLAHNLQGDPLLHGVISSVKCKESLHEIELIPSRRDIG